MFNKATFSRRRALVVGLVAGLLLSLGGLNLRGNDADNPDHVGWFTVLSGDGLIWLQPGIAGRNVIASTNAGNTESRDLRFQGWRGQNIGNALFAADFLQVFGAGREKAYLGGDGLGNDVELGSLNPNVTTLSLWNEAAGSRMNLAAGSISATGAISSGTAGSIAGAITLYPPDGAPWFHIDNIGSTAGTAGRLRISHGGNPGDNELLSILENGNVGIGIVDPAAKLHVAGESVEVKAGIDDSGIGLESRGPVAGVRALATASTGTNYAVYGATNSSDGYGGYFIGKVSIDVSHLSGPSGRLALVLNGSPDNEDIGIDINKSRLYIWNIRDNIRGDLIVRNLEATGTKNFVQPHPTDPTKEIVYVSLEGPEAGTYIRGTAELVDGEAVIELPEHFGLVTSDEGLTVQLTPLGGWLQLYVVERSPRRLVVREANGKDGRFDYLVQGVRRGYEGHQVIRDKE